jgi:hypothetical protein
MVHFGIVETGVEDNRDMKDDYDKSENHSVVPWFQR